MIKFDISRIESNTLIFPNVAPQVTTQAKTTSGKQLC